MSLKKYAVVLSLAVAILGSIPGSIFVLGMLTFLNTQPTRR